MLNGNISRLLKLTRIFFNYFLENLSKQIINLGGHVSSDIIIVICHSARRIMASSPQENIKGSTGDEGQQNSETRNEEKKDDSIFECNICLDTARDAVVSMCGHLFCWPCLHQWLETRPNRQVCPVCKAAISKEKVVPLYGRGSTKQEDPREKVPPRPAGQRTEPEPGSSFPGFGFGDNSFHMSFGIGAFPFGFFTSTFNFGEPRPAAAAHGTHQHMEEQFLSKIFLWLAILFLTWLLMA